jgi:hypothetical protein
MKPGPKPPNEAAKIFAKNLEIGLETLELLQGAIAEFHGKTGQWGLGELVLVKEQGEKVRAALREVDCRLREKLARMRRKKVGGLLEYLQ